MTENEAIDIIHDKIETCEFYFAENDRYPKWCEYEFLESLGAAISALKEIQQYREVGTVEEFREAREKQIPKAPIMKPYYEDMPDEEYLCCPTCGDILTDRIPDDNKNFYFHCLNCGQKFDWREEDTK